MVNKEQLEILQQGAAVWNKWRAENPEEQIDLIAADLTEANLCKANLTGSFLTYASLVRTNLERALLTDCIVYGISTWEPNLESATQKDLVIAPPGQPAVTVVDNIEDAYSYISLYS